MPRSAGLVLALTLPLLSPCAGATHDAHSAHQRPDWPAQPAGRASRAFSETWGDGRAELSSYEAVVPRYGELWPAELVLVYVTEPMDRETRIKDDDARGAARVPVMKLVTSLKFQTGVYPYSILTTTFAPVDAYTRERFTPIKVTMSAQEWCGHVFEGVWPGESAFAREGYSYFASDGETRETVQTPGDTVYEDALFVQLRELDGPFAGGRDFRGSLVPSLWRNRRAHRPLRPVPVRITRSTVGDVNRFVIATEEFERVVEVERTGARRILGWTTSDGERARLAGTDRLAYWERNRPGDEVVRERFGLPTTTLPRPSSPEGMQVGF